MSDTRIMAITAAEESAASLAAQVADDPYRPTYHFRPPCCWMNDPNGVVWHDGYYHLFYQFNPYGDTWGNIHWGHARSKDLVRWERLPIALWPSLELGEMHCFSGCLSFTQSGEPIIFYTSVAPVDERPFEQWAALGDAELTEWRKHPRNPMLALEAEGLPDFELTWRDPFVFAADDRTFMALGAATETQSHVILFESNDPELFEWQYRDSIYSQPKNQMRFCECPNFFSLDGKFVLLLSPYRNVEYTIGMFDAASLRYTPETTGILDHGITRVSTVGEDLTPRESANYYATNVLSDPDGRCVVFGWIRNFRAGQGWNGCLALPRLLTIGADGRPRQEPVPELKQLRSELLADDLKLHVNNQAIRLDTVSGELLELQVRLEMGSASRAGLYLRANRETMGGVQISYDGCELCVDDTVVKLAADNALTLHIYLDRTVTEIFVNHGAEAITNVAYLPLEDHSVWVTAEDGDATFSEINAWRLSSIG